MSLRIMSTPVLASAGVVALGLSAFGYWQRQSFFQWVQTGQEALAHSDGELLIEQQELPPSVQLYLNIVLRDRDQRHLVQWRQAGVMMLKPGAKETPFTATQIIQTTKPGFSWFAEMRMMPMLSAWVCDRLVGGEGSLKARLGGVFSLVDMQGPDVLKGQLLRYLAELPWAPWAMLYQKDLVWEPVGEHEVAVERELNGVTARVVFHFNESGLIDRATATDRPRAREDGRGSEPTPWEGEFSDYQEINNVLVPLEGTVSWLLPSGRFTYFKGRISAP